MCLTKILRGGGGGLGVVLLSLGKTDPSLRRAAFVALLSLSIPFQGKLSSVML